MNRIQACALGAAVLAACTAPESRSSKQLPPQAPPAAPVAEGVPEAILKLTPQEEADAKAAQAISKQNADAELEKLKKELSGGG